MSEFSFHIASYSDCASALIEFRNANRAIQRDRAYADWRYAQRPCALPSFVVWAMRGSEHAGTISVFPHDYFIIDGEYPLGVLGDISVDTRFRGHGLAEGMLRFLAQSDEARSLRGALVLPNEAAARSCVKAGWHESERIARFAKQLDFRELCRRVVANRTLSRALAFPLNMMARWASGEAMPRRRNFRAELVAEIGSEFDDLWQRAQKQGKFLSVRNRRYLRWRYETHPVTAYRMLAIRENGALCGYAMYRCDGTVCYVDDVFCATHERHAAPLVALLLEHLREQSGIATVSVSINDGPNGFPWRWFGFMRRVDYQRVMRSPAQLSGDSRESAAAWYVTAGDKDV